MTKEESKQKTPHCLSLDNRKKLMLTGISDVDSFDDKSIEAYTDMGKLIISGERLNIKKLNLEVGELEVMGKICSLVYADNKNSKNKFFTKIFKQDKR